MGGGGSPGARGTGLPATMGGMPGTRMMAPVGNGLEPRGRTDGKLGMKIDGPACIAFTAARSFQGDHEIRTLALSDTDKGPRTPDKPKSKEGGQQQSKKPEKSPEKETNKKEQKPDQKAVQKAVPKIGPKDSQKESAEDVPKAPQKDVQNNAPKASKDTKKDAQKDVQKPSAKNDAKEVSKGSPPRIPTKMMKTMTA
ncbi:hypothetical protein MRX96_016378 [Rhipicephalus microplus]